MSRFLPIAAILLAGGPIALGEPYQVAYEGDIFPETEGWDRFMSNGGSDRALNGGMLELHTQDPLVSDAYCLEREAPSDAGPGEVFYVEWRMRVLPGSGIADVGLHITSDNLAGEILLAYSEDYFWSLLDSNNFPIDATVFRTYRIESFDMLIYDFFVDGEYVYTGIFDPPGLSTSTLCFGDTEQGQASSSDWDFVRFGAATLGDLDNSGLVNLADFATFARCFGVSLGAPGASCTGSEANQSDLDRNGVVELSDFATLASNFGT